MIAKLIWRNLWRNSRRTLITIASIAFAVIFSILMQSFQNGVFNNLIKNVVNYYSGYVQIHQKGYWDERIVDNSFEINEALIAKIRDNSSIIEVVPRLETFVLASYENNTKGCMLVGTHTEKENNLTKLKGKILSGTYFKNNKEDVLVAEGLAKRLNIKVNDTLVLFGQGFHSVMAAGKYKVKGILHLASPDMNNAFAYLPISATQSFLSANNRVTSISLGIETPENLNLITSDIGKNIGQKYEVMSWQEMMPEIANHIKADGFSFYVFSGILYLIIGFGLFGTVLMMTVERKFEFGMLIAIGMKKSKLKLMLLGETFLITILGVLFGILLSFPIVVYWSKNPIRLRGEVANVYEQFGFEALFPTEPDPSIFIRQSLIVLVMALLIGLYPLWHISYLNPVKEIKK